MYEVEILHLVDWFICILSALFAKHFGVLH